MALARGRTSIARTATSFIDPRRTSTTFAKAGFDVESYLACRPTYSQRVFDIVLAYHKHNGGRYDRALDIGCGPGFVALALTRHFKSVMAVDPSVSMLAKGLQPAGGPPIDYRPGTVECLDDVGVKSGEDGVDLVVAGQAAHWFNDDEAWEQLTRAVRPGGTVAFINYACMTAPNHPKMDAFLREYMYGESTLGPYWELGRFICEELLDPIAFPTKPEHDASTRKLLASLPPLDPAQGSKGGKGQLKAAAIEKDRIGPLTVPERNDEWDPATAVRLKTEGNPEKPLLMRKTFSQETLLGYLRSLSAGHNYLAAHPKERARTGKGGKDGDLNERTCAAIWDMYARDGGAKGLEKPGEIEIGWPLVLMMIKKKPKGKEEEPEWLQALQSIKGRRGRNSY